MGIHAGLPIRDSLNDGVGIDPVKKAIIAERVVANVLGKQIEHLSPGRCAWSTDFLGDTIPAEFNAALGTAPPTAAITTGKSGLLLVTTGGTAGTMAADGVCLNLGALNFTAAENPAMEVRLKLSAVTSVSLFVGFTDSTALEAPISLSGTTFTSNASDACGILYDSSATTDVWNLIGVDTDVDTSAVALTTAPAAATYVTLRVEVSSDGSFKVAINGQYVGSIVESAVTPTVAITPVISIFPRSALALTMTVDYFHVSADRA